jgi:hypothetical protein
MYTTCFHDLLPKEVFSVISSIKSMLRCWTGPNSSVYRSIRSNY